LKRRIDELESKVARLQTLPQQQTEKLENLTDALQTYERRMAAKFENLRKENDENRSFMMKQDASISQTIQRASLLEDGDWLLKVASRCKP
jgi:molecular chaperone GrpE (heat shock protein)